jgi:hypothetical protein
MGYGQFRSVLFAPCCDLAHKEGSSSTYKDWARLVLRVMERNDRWLLLMSSMWQPHREKYYKAVLWSRNRNFYCGFGY